ARSVGSENNVSKTVVIEIARRSDGAPDFIESGTKDNCVGAGSRKRSAHRTVEEIDPARLNTVGIIAARSDKNVTDPIAVDVAGRRNGKSEIITKGLRGNGGDSLGSVNVFGEWPLEQI